MVIVPIFYTVAPWLVFFKLKIVPLNWMSGAVAALCGILILATLLALLNSLTPSGGIVVIGRVVELTSRSTSRRCSKRYRSMASCNGAWLARVNFSPRLYAPIALRTTSWRNECLPESEI